tara:strand:+ start:426 stop:623 length:198 start_codon:yes stop_codon:yes gene_type:complete
MDTTSTATVKFTREEIEVILNSLKLILNTDLPIDEDFLKPYYVLKLDLEEIRKSLVDGEQQVNNV